MGVELIRTHIAEFIKRRDGLPSSAKQIFLTDGASKGIQQVLNLTIRNNKDGVMIPIPQYPLYTATIALLNGREVPYYLNEEKNWGLEMTELEDSYNHAKKQGVEPRAIVIINPGNPTGAVLPRSDLDEIIRFCAERKIILLADEVYQSNVYNPQRPFVSFKKALMESKYREDVELFSFHSVSKGLLGECGFRGGYCELTNIDMDAHAQLVKLASIALCPNLPGQVMCDLMVTPPKPGEPSYELYKKETDSIYQSLKRRAAKLNAGLNRLEGVTCCPLDGAMYAFPQIRLPPAFVAAARLKNKEPDVMYCLEMLDETGVCVVPGSGFLQRNGTYHFRTTFLPQEDKIDAVVDRVSHFHAQFMEKYRS